MNVKNLPVSNLCTTRKPLDNQLLDQEHRRLQNMINDIDDLIKEVYRAQINLPNYAEAYTLYEGDAESWSKRLSAYIADLDDQRIKFMKHQDNLVLANMILSGNYANKIEYSDMLYVTNHFLTVVGDCDES